VVGVVAYRLTLWAPLGAAHAVPPPPSAAERATATPVLSLLWPCAHATWPRPHRCHLTTPATVAHRPQRPFMRHTRPPTRIRIRASTRHRSTLTW